MGRGKGWSAEESLHLAEAWIEASEDVDAVVVKGTDQDADDFWKKVYKMFVPKTPPNHLSGTYKDRSTGAMQSHWSERIARQVKAFNKSLLLVLNSNPTGCTEQNKINMAVAIQLGKCSAMSYNNKDFQARDWKFYPCWEVLRTHRAFLPPKAATEENTVDMDEDDSDEDANNGGNNSTSPSASSASGGSVKTNLFTPTPKRSRSRGPGAGKKKTKAAHGEEEYKKKRIEMQEHLLQVQKKRQEDFAKLVEAQSQQVKNTARTEAFKMARLGYVTFVDTDPAEAARYKQKMDDIMSLNTKGEEENSDSESDTDMPALTGNGGEEADGTGV